MGPTSEAKLRRVQTYFKDAHATVNRKAGVLVGIYLSASQATTSGEGNQPTTKEFYGKDYAEALEAAAKFVEEKLVGFHI